MQLLGLWGPWWHQVCRDMDCLSHRSYGPIRVFFFSLRASLVAQLVKNSPAIQEKGMAIHSSIRTWRIPWTEESGRLQSVGLQRIGHD